MSDPAAGHDLPDVPEAFCEDHPRFEELYGLAWRLAACHTRTSRGRRHMDAAWSSEVNYQWVWDTCFMALYCRYAARTYPGVESLDNFYDRQAGDGYIGMTYDMTTGEEPWPDRINPPLFAWVEWEHYRTTGDASRFARVLPHIERLMHWIDANRRTRPHKRIATTRADERIAERPEDNYSLYWFEDCGSSGMDDAPRAPRYPEAGRFLDWIDLSSQMALSFRMLSQMHAVQGNRAAADAWDARAGETGALINAELWCPRTPCGNATVRNTPCRASRPADASA